MTKTLQSSSKLSESALFFKIKYEATSSGKQKSLLLQMADAFHYRVQIFIAPYNKGCTPKWRP